MTEKQKLIYDLSMQCALYRVYETGAHDKSLAAAMLNAFTESIRAYSCMAPNALDKALEAIDDLKKV